LVLLQGVASPLLGHTIVHLEHFFNSDTATMAVTFTIHMAGYLTGSIVCGFTFDHVNHELAFAVANIVQGSATVVAPFLGSVGGLVLFTAVMCIQAMSQGFIDAGKSLAL
jgi:sugar phosphate permease